MTIRTTRDRKDNRVLYLENYRAAKKIKGLRKRGERRKARQKLGMVAALV